MIKRLIKEIITPGPRWRHRVKTAASCAWLITCNRHPRLASACIATVRTLLCKNFGHAWKDFTPIPGGDFGTARRCPRCGLYQRMHRGKATLYNTHTRNGWQKLPEA